MKTIYKTLFFFILLLSIGVVTYKSTRTSPLQIHIIGYRNGVGLNKDIDLLTEELTKLGHHVRFVSVHELKPKEKADVNLFVDIFDEYFFPYANRNYLLPNPEWCFSTPQQLRKFDKILCKTKESERIFKAINPHSEFISFTSRDCYDPSVKKNYKAPLHLAGASIQKGTDSVIRVWLDNPQFPTLSVVRHKGQSWYPPAVNLTLIYDYLSESDLNQIRNQCGLHICPSETEGFGHYIMEALSSGNIVITTNAPPMNEFIHDNRCLAGYSHSAPWRLATSYFVDPAKLDLTVAEILSLEEKELKKIGLNNRNLFLKNHRFFKKRLAEVFSKKTVYKPLSWDRTDFVWNLGIASQGSMNINQDPYNLFENYYNRKVELSLDKLKKDSVVFLRTIDVPEFTQHYLPKIHHPITLIISDGDESFPSACAPYHEKLIESDKIKHIFAQNCDYRGSSKKISHIPIGLDYHSIAYKGGWFGEPCMSPLEQEKILKTTLKAAKPTHTRKKRAFVDFYLSDSIRNGDCNRYLELGEDRTSIYERLLNITDKIDYSSPMKRSDLWKNKIQYAFSISPHGNGLDCHRTWEDLILGCIVIVKTSPLDPLYEGLPVVIVKDWDEITEENLNRWFDKYGDAFTNPSYREKLTNRYWLQKIKAKARA